MNYYFWLGKDGEPDAIEYTEPAWWIEQDMDQRWIADQKWIEEKFGRKVIFWDLVMTGPTYED